MDNDDLAIDYTTNYVWSCNQRGEINSFYRSRCRRCRNNNSNYNKTISH